MKRTGSPKNDMYLALLAKFEKAAGAYTSPTTTLEWVVDNYGVLPEVQKTEELK